MLDGHLISILCSAANYNVAANNLYSQTDILGTNISLVDRTGNGIVWDTFNNVSLLPARCVHAGGACQGPVFRCQAQCQSTARVWGKYRAPSNPATECLDL